MIKLLIELCAPMLALFIFVLGTGFTFTQMGIALTANGVSNFVTGAMTAVFYGGLLLGSGCMEGLIIRIRHVRAYIIFAIILALTYFLQSMYYSISVWVIIRFIAGFATAGLYVVIESWLLARSERYNRGRVLSIYMILFYASQSLGQFFINIPHEYPGFLFLLSGILCLVSILPFTIIKGPSPTPATTSTISMKNLLKQTFAPICGSFASGMIMGAIYGLIPAVLSFHFHNSFIISAYMFVIIMGGVTLQYPIGKFSDNFDRSKVYIATSSAIILVSLLLLIFPTGPQAFWYLVMALFGGLTFTLYPLGIAAACDELDENDIIPVTQAMLIAYSAGAMAGPVVAPLFMGILHGNGLFIYMIFVAGLTILPFMQRKSAVKLNLPQNI